MLGLGLSLTSVAVLGGGISLANQALANETEGLALNFIDLSARVKDLTTPANNFSGNVNNLLTYSAPSTKWIRTKTGLWLSGTSIRTEYDESAAALGARFEEQRVSLALRARRLDNATHWTASNVTTSAVQGVDGVSGSATRITATANNGTILGSLNTSASAARRFAPFIRRVAGVGNLEYTFDGGSTWTAFTGITSSFARNGVGATVSNPRLGFRIVSSGDEFDIDFANGETGAVDTSPLESTDSHVTRAADNITLATSKFPYSTSALTWQAEVNVPAFLSKTTGILEVNGLVYDQSNRLFLAIEDGFDYRAIVRADSVSGFNPAAGTTAEYTQGTNTKIALAVQSNDLAYVADGAVIATDSSVTVPTTGAKVRFGGLAENDNLQLNGHLRKIVFVPRRVTNTELQTLTGA